MTTDIIFRRSATDGEVDQLALQVRSLCLEGLDAVQVLLALRDGLEGSAYESYGSVDLDWMAGVMNQEIRNFDPAELEHEQTEARRMAR